MPDQNDELAGELSLGAPYHIGIAVHDMDEAMRTYGAAFGVGAWRVNELPDLGARRGGNLHWHGQPHERIGLKFAYSVTEQPFLELVQPLNDVEWSATQHLREHGEGIYHLGYWVDDILAVIERAAQHGIAAELTSIAEARGGQPPSGMAYLDPQGAHGLRVELVSSAGRESMLRWIHGGEWGA